MGDSLLPYLIIPGGLTQFYESTIEMNLKIYGQARASYRLAWTASASIGILCDLLARPSAQNFGIPKNS